MSGVLQKNAKKLRVIDETAVAVLVVQDRNQGDRPYRSCQLLMTKSGGRFACPEFSRQGKNEH
jgi:hypothetical protein